MKKYILAVLQEHLSRLYPAKPPHSVPHLKNMLAKTARNARRIDSQCALHFLQLSASHTLYLHHYAKHLPPLIGKEL
jgi:hypothetical protein